jgi:hypothetical protein
MLPIPRLVPINLRTQNCKRDLSGKYNPIALPPASSLALKELERCTVPPEVLLCLPAMQHDWLSRLSSLPLSRAGASHASPWSPCSPHSNNCRYKGSRLVACLHGITICSFPEAARTKQRIHNGKEIHSWERNPLAPSPPKSKRYQL